MNNKIKKILEDIVTLDEIRPCKCDAKHEYCLSCPTCRVTKIKPKINYEQLHQYIDHTILRADAQTDDIIELCKQANKYKFKSVCLNPCHIEAAKKYITGKTTLVCTVIGFPLGANTTVVKLIETQQALDTGAKEIDMVINIGWLKDKEYQKIMSEIHILATTCQQNDAILKVIIETCLLTQEEIVIACLIAKKAGADFVKTSTGFSVKGAVKEDVQLMRDVVGSYMGVKASGGIRSKEDAIAMLKAGANRLGTSNSIKIVEP